MLRAVVYLLLVVALLNSCKTQKNVNVISIGYHSDNCADCNALKLKMKAMNRKFFFEPIVFIKYDKTNQNSKIRAERKLREWQMLSIAHRDDGLKYVILYAAKSKKVIQRINFDDKPDVIEVKIDDALRQAKN
jgi:hypothetical protein